jgi:hypothetical protein
MVFLNRFSFLRKGRFIISSRPCVCPLQIRLDQWMGLHKTWYERHVTRGNPISFIFNFILLTPTWYPRQCLALTPHNALKTGAVRTSFVTYVEYVYSVDYMQYTNINRTTGTGQCTLRPANKSDNSLFAQSA